MTNDEDELVLFYVATCPRCHNDMMQRGVPTLGFIKGVWQCGSCGAEFITEGGTGLLWENTGMKMPETRWIKASEYRSKKKEESE